MVKVIGPLGGFDASGSLAGALTWSKWKGRNYVRRLVKPSNPKSGGQVGVRSMFKFLSQNWATIGSTPQASWEARAEATSISPFNAYMSLNQFNWRNFLTPSQPNPPTRAETVDGIDTFTATAGVRQITITINDLDVAGLNWGFLIFKSLSTGFTPSVANLVAAIISAQATEVLWVDTPLVPDTYYYDAKPFTFDGAEGALKGEINAVVT